MELNGAFFASGKNDFGGLLLVATLFVLCVGTVSASVNVLDDAETGDVTDFWQDKEGDGLYAQYENQFSDSEDSRSLNLEYSSSDGWQWLDARNPPVYEKGDGNLTIMARMSGGGKGRIAVGHDEDDGDSDSASIRFMSPNDRYCYGRGSDRFDDYCVYENQYEFEFVTAKINWTAENYDFWVYDGSDNLVFHKTLDNTYENSGAGNIEIQAGGQGEAYYDYLTIEEPNSAPVFDSVSVSPSSWSLGSGVGVSVNVSDDGAGVDGVNASVWENGSEIESGVSLSDSDGDGVWEVSDLFSVDESDVWYNVSMTATDDSGASTVKWINKSVVGSELSWSDESDNEDGFRIYSNVSGGDFVEVGSVDAGETSFSYGTSVLSFDESRCFQVTAYNEYGESSPAENCLKP